jgi:hypothetical protein
VASGTAYSSGGGPQVASGIIYSSGGGPQGASGTAYSSGGPQGASGTAYSSGGPQGPSGTAYSSSGSQGASETVYSSGGDSDAASAAAGLQATIRKLQRREVGSDFATAQSLEELQQAVEEVDLVDAVLEAGGGSADPGLDSTG